MCERSGVELDTSVIDQLLSLFKNEEHFIFSTLSPLPGRMNPYYGKYVNQHTYTAVSNDRNMTLSPDVDLVGYGVAKNVTALQFSTFVQDRGVDLLDCTQLTKFVQDRGVDLLDCTQLTKFVQDRGVDLLDCTQLTNLCMTEDDVTVSFDINHLRYLDEHEH